MKKKHPGGQGGHLGQGIPWGHRVGLMSLFMIHKAYMPVYKWSRFFLRDGTDERTDQPKVVQEVLADLKKEGLCSSSNIANIWKMGYSSCVKI